MSKGIRNCFQGTIRRKLKMLACEFSWQIPLRGELVVEVLEFCLPSLRGDSKGSDLLCKVHLGAGGDQK